MLCTGSETHVWHNWFIERPRTTLCFSMSGVVLLQPNARLVFYIIQFSTERIKPNYTMRAEGHKTVICHDTRNHPQYSQSLVAKLGTINLFPEQGIEPAFRQRKIKEKDIIKIRFAQKLCGEYIWYVNIKKYISAVHMHNSFCCHYFSKGLMSYKSIWTQIWGQISGYRDDHQRDWALLMALTITVNIQGHFAKNLLVI